MMDDQDNESVRGRLLIAAPTLPDGNFSRTVVLMAEHSDDGAMGVILNRPATVTVGEAVEDLSGVVDPDEPVYVGGPVQQQSVIVLAEFDDESLAGELILPGIGFAGAGSDFDELASSVLRARVFAGCAGWAPGQLEAELEREDWIVADPDPEDLFADEADELWAAVLRRMGGNYALIARMPVDPSVN
jgi:putative transcriptional regulator